jgi:hypothetical protein
MAPSHGRLGSTETILSEDTMNPGFTTQGHPQSLQIQVVPGIPGRGRGQV